MIARLHAMHQRSRMLLNILVIVLLAVDIACTAIAATGLRDIVAEELILSGAYICNYGYEGYIFNGLDARRCFGGPRTVSFSLYCCETLSCQPAMTRTIGDCFRVLIKCHVFYLTSSSFVCASCLQLGLLSVELSNPDSIGVLTFYGVVQILFGVQMFVLGPRLILSIITQNSWQTPTQKLA
ncbi:uncharacterized protein F5147DRAFT_244163 [Suillus discolor]|uniref:Uncharacterized protein n=1 Tax=Suillus discolor TaxID=1912936 RepID=A0A9P7F4K5_9AGAM|nr:uncharacterized protein F5147DRAFT_244163 [Suillus discolor]KAG2105032.1 hypothetical protein F5147DRAFT_244163 [Suillus discolor]